MRKIQDFEYERLRKTFSDVSKNLIDFELQMAAQFSGVVYYWTERGYNGYLDFGKATQVEKNYTTGGGGTLEVASQAYSKLAATLKIPTDYKYLTVNSPAAPAQAQGATFEFIQFKEVLGGTVMVDNAIIIQYVRLKRMYGVAPLNLFTDFYIVPDQEPKIQVDGIIYDVEATNYNNW
jgi:hypothetical protein